MTDYTPVDCGLHSKYELVIMHRQTLRLTWRDTDGEQQTKTVIPADLRTRGHEEFLMVTGNDGIEQAVRLDRIEHSSQTQDTNDIQAIRCKSQLLKTNLRKNARITRLI
jgi:transcriptional antiterminator Rof (Rho-off)